MKGIINPTSTKKPSRFLRKRHGATGLEEFEAKGGWGLFGGRGVKNRYLKLHVNQDELGFQGFVET